MVKELLETTYLEVEERNKTILELSLKLQRRKIQIAMLGAITYDALLDCVVDSEQTLHNYTIRVIVHAVRKEIRRLTE